MYSVQLPEEMGRRLADFAAKREYSESVCLQRALEQFFLDEEGDERLAEIALARLEKGAPTIPWEEAKKRLGLRDEDLAD